MYPACGTSHMSLMLYRQVSSEGKPLRSLTDMDGKRISTISGVTEHGDRLYFGFLTGDYIAYVDFKGHQSKRILA